MQLDWLKQAALYSPQKVAIVDGDHGTELNYKELYQKAQRGASYLKNKYNIQAHHRVAVLATNEVEYLILFFSLQRLGATLIPVNFRLTSREIEHILQDSDPHLILTQETYCPLLSSLKSVDRRQLGLLQGPNSFAEALDPEKSPLFPDFASTAENCALILYTSGTTGTPKGAMLSHRMLFWNSINTTWRLNITPQDSAVIFLPFFHTGGWNVLTTPFFHRGAKIIFLRKFDTQKVLSLTANYQCSLLFGVPTTLDMMSQCPLFKTVDLSHLRYAIVGGEPMSLSLIQQWHDKKVPIRQGYGLTEFGPNVFSLNEEDAIRKIGSIGFPNYNIEVKVVNSKGLQVSTGEIGELCLKGSAMMSGYWNNPKATLEALDGDWLKTGDLVRFDSEGYFYVAGRLKEMYKSGGENVYPVEIEHVLRHHPQVHEAAVVGVPDSQWGEVGHAFVVPHTKNLSTHELLTFCRQNLAKFKTPKYVTFMESLPKGENGKVLKKKLHEFSSKGC